MTESHTEHQLIQASLKIGAICDVTSSWTAEFAAFLDAGGFVVADLTVARLIDLCHEFDDRHGVPGPPADRALNVPAFLKEQAD